MFEWHRNGRLLYLRRLPSDVTGDSYAVSLDSLLPDIP